MYLHQHQSTLIKYWNSIYVFEVRFDRVVQRNILAHGAYGDNFFSIRSKHIFMRFKFISFIQTNKKPILCTMFFEIKFKVWLYFIFCYFHIKCTLKLQIESLNSISFVILISSYKYDDRTYWQFKTTKMNNSIVFLWFSYTLFGVQSTHSLTDSNVQWDNFVNCWQMFTKNFWRISKCNWHGLKFTHENF